MGYAVLFNSVTPAAGSAHTVENPDILQNVNVQIVPSTNTAWEVDIDGRLSDADPWVELKKVAEDDEPLELLFELPTYPQYRAQLNSVTGSPAVAVKVAISYAPAAGNVLTSVQPTSEHDYLNPEEE